MTMLMAVVRTNWAPLPTPDHRIRAMVEEVNVVRLKSLPRHGSGEKRKLVHQKLVPQVQNLFVKGRQVQPAGLSLSDCQGRSFSGPDFIQAGKGSERMSTILRK